MELRVESPPFNREVVGSFVVVESEVLEGKMELEGDRERCGRENIRPSFDRVVVLCFFGSRPFLVGDMRGRRVDGDAAECRPNPAPVLSDLSDEVRDRDGYNVSVNLGSKIGRGCHVISLTRGQRRLVIATARLLRRAKCFVAFG